jgi:hypothetical protein
MGLDLLTPLGFGYHPIASTEPLVWVLHLGTAVKADPSSSKQRFIPDNAQIPVPRLSKTMSRATVLVRPQKRRQ